MVISVIKSFFVEPRTDVLRNKIIYGRTKIKCRLDFFFGGGGKPGPFNSVEFAIIYFLTIIYFKGRELTPQEIQEIPSKLEKLG